MSVETQVQECDEVVFCSINYPVSEKQIRIYFEGMPGKCLLTNIKHDENGSPTFEVKFKDEKDFFFFTETVNYIREDIKIYWRTKTRNYTR
jgi:hypothetical protein